MVDNKRKTIHYDQTLKNLFNISNRLTIYAINALFKRNFNENAKIEQLNREYIRLDKTTAIADTVLSIEIDKQRTKHHIEFQTLNDRTIIIRMLDYGFRIAIDDLEYNNIKEKEITIEFPSQIIIFLKENHSIPDELRLTIKMPYSQQEIKYLVPTFKIWEHDPAYYKRQKLYIMLPLQIIVLREQLENLRKRKLNEKEKTRLKRAYREKITNVIEAIIKELKNALISDELIIEECNQILIELSSLADELFSCEIKEIKQEVNVMAKMIIDPDIYKKGLEEGKRIIDPETYKKGLEEGKRIIDPETYKKGLEEGKRIIDPETYKKGLEEGKRIIDPETYKKGLEEGKRIIDPETYKKGLEEGKRVIDPETYKKGLEEGKRVIDPETYKKGLEEGRESGIVETILRLLSKKLGELPGEYVEKIKAQDKSILEIITDNIFDIDNLEDLDRYIIQ